MSLAGLAEAFYNVTATLATFFLSHRSLHPLCHSWEKEMPGSHPPLQLTPANMGLNCWQTGEQQNLILELRIDICSPWPAWLWIQSAGWRNGRSGVKLAHLCSVGLRPCSSCNPWAGPCQDMGLEESIRALQASWRDITAAAWAPFRTSGCWLL